MGYHLVIYECAKWKFTIFERQISKLNGTPIQFYNSYVSLLQDGPFWGVQVLILIKKNELIDWIIRKGLGTIKIKRLLVCHHVPVNPLSLPF